MSRVLTFPLGPLETNCYLLVNGSRAVVVDPGGPPARLVRHLRDKGLTLERICISHFHFDHIQGVAALVEATGAPVSASPAGAPLLDTELGGGGFMGFADTPRFAYEPLEEGETTFAGLSCRVLSTPGHADGSLSFHFPDLSCVCVGDVVFYRSIGRTDFPGGSLELLVDMARSKILSLPGETVIYPGHGPSTTVADEKLHNPYLSGVGLDAGDYA